MYIDKAIKKQRNAYKIFIFSMIVMQVILPLVIIFLTLYTKFIIGYLIILEIFILIAIFMVYKDLALKYKCKNGFLVVKPSIVEKSKVINCEDVHLVHTSKSLDNMNILIILSCKKRRNSFKRININLLNKHPLLSKEYKKLTVLYPEKSFYYTIIKHGGLEKFKLLDLIYKNCVKAIYTDNSIENIKIAREQKEIILSRKWW
ncbi:hypothetical protein [Clostridium tarantellae]|uniref:Uncharacterized protein n=1 Tax=Clostridium tarantellae TaxID=39493 RepID=A0A6I1MJE6_9CLOT|nr:hypothetical protein [Clostridium tarantellae]MPQ42528.1 hypothetical protein [Clostridium tarantellae]